MSFLRRLEVGCGITTVVLALVVSVRIGPFGPPYNLLPILMELLGAIVFFVGPALLVAVGSYFHAARRKTSGLTMLWVGGLFLTLMLFVHALGGVFYLYGLWGGPGVLTPSVGAIITLVASLLWSKGSPPPNFPGLRSEHI